MTKFFHFLQFLQNEYYAQTAYCKGKVLHILRKSILTRYIAAGVIYLKRDPNFIACCDYANNQQLR